MRSNTNNRPQNNRPNNTTKIALTEKEEKIFEYYKDVKDGLTKSLHKARNIHDFVTKATGSETAINIASGAIAALTPGGSAVKAIGAGVSTIMKMKREQKYKEGFKFLGKIGFHNIDNFINRLSHKLTEIRKEEVSNSSGLDNYAEDDVKRVMGSLKEVTKNDEIESVENYYNMVMSPKSSQIDQDAKIDEIILEMLNHLDLNSKIETPIQPKTPRNIQNKFLHSALRGSRGSNLNNSINAYSSPFTTNIIEDENEMSRIENIELDQTEIEEIDSLRKRLFTDDEEKFGFDTDASLEICDGFDEDLDEPEETFEKYDGFDYGKSEETFDGFGEDTDESNKNFPDSDDDTDEFPGFDVDYQTETPTNWRSFVNAGDKPLNGRQARSH